MTVTLFVAQIKETSKRFDERDGKETGVNADATGAKPRQRGK